MMKTHLSALYRSRTLRSFILFLAASGADGIGVRAAEGAARTSSPTSDAPNAAVQQALNELRGQLPSQSHTMADVAYHFSNLWFAGQAKNWPLAEFYASETKSHLRWAVRVKPVRPLSGGGQLRLADVLTPIEQGPLKEVHDSVAAKDPARFATAYRQMLASCYGCHVAAEKPYLRLHVPERPPETMIDFAPAPADGGASR